MRLVEPISRERLDDLIEDIYREILTMSLSDRRIDELASLLHEEFEFLFSYGASEYIRLTE
jgi:hypothetical protein